MCSKVPTSEASVPGGTIAGDGRDSGTSPSLPPAGKSVAGFLRQSIISTSNCGLVTVGVPAAVLRSVDKAPPHYNLPHSVTNLARLHASRI